jgi:hypothetical protein
MPFKTRGDVLSLHLTMALARAVKIVRGLRKGLSREEREAVAYDTMKRVAALREDPWGLNEELPPSTAAVGHGAPEGWDKPNPPGLVCAPLNLTMGRFPIRNIFEMKLNPPLRVTRQQPREDPRCGSKFG